MNPIVEQIYQAYPRHVGKLAAIKAIQGAIKRNGITPERLLERVNLFCRIVKPVLKTSGGQFIPHPSTWFNQGRWDDDADEWRRFAQDHTPAPIVATPHFGGPSPAERAHRQDILAQAALLTDEEIEARCARLGGFFPSAWAAGRLRRDSFGDMEAVVGATG